MGSYDIDTEVYKKWLEERIITIEAMTTKDQIEARIIEISKIEFLAKREWALLHQQYDKITGRKGIAPWLKVERDKLITDPNIKVNWEGEPRVKPKKEKIDVSDMLGIPKHILEASLKDRLKDKKNGGTIDGFVPKGSAHVRKEAEPSNPMALLMNVEKKKVTPKEEIAARVKAMMDARKK